MSLYYLSPSTNTYLKYSVNQMILYNCRSYIHVLDFKATFRHTSGKLSNWSTVGTDRHWVTTVQVTFNFTHNRSKLSNYLAVIIHPLNGAIPVNQQFCKNPQYWWSNFNFQVFFVMVGGVYFDNKWCLYRHIVKCTDVLSEQ